MLNLESKDLHLHEVIHYLMTIRGTTAVLLAKKLKVSYSTIYSIEIGRRKPSHDLLYRLAKELDFQFELLLAIRDKPLNSTRSSFYDPTGILNEVQTIKAFFRLRQILNRGVKSVSFRAQR